MSCSTIHFAEMRVLFVSAGPSQAANNDGIAWWKKELANCLEVTYVSPREGLEIARKQAFDAAVLLRCNRFDALGYLAMLRATGASEFATLMATHEVDPDFEAECCRRDADGCAMGCPGAPGWFECQLQRAVERNQFRSAASHWDSHQKRMKQVDQRAAIHQIRAIRGVLLEGMAVGTNPTPPSWLTDRLEGILRAYVVSVGSDVSDEVQSMVCSLQKSGITQCEALLAHSVATERLMLSLGNRPGSHVLNRSQLLAFEMMTHFTHLEEFAACRVGPSAV